MSLHPFLATPAKQLYNSNNIHENADDVIVNSLALANLEQVLQV